MNVYTVNEIFYSLQGEGMRAGEASVFVRFSGCNSKCLKETHGFDCDTEYVSGRRLGLDAIMTWIIEEAGPCRWVVLTGGEPGLQVSADLITALHDEHFKVAIETNGSVDLSAFELDWITVSPKVAEHAIRQMKADEIKYVRGYGQGLPRPKCEAANKLISPATNGSEIDHRTLLWCIDLVRQDPSWRLSLQYHKVWRVR